MSRHDRLCVRRTGAKAHLDSVAEAVVTATSSFQSASREEPLEVLAGRIDAGLVVAAGIDIRRLLRKSKHRILLAGEPTRDCPRRIGECRHDRSVRT
ncbi:MAG: hypothetical protein ACREC6_01860 [Hyphomicrobiaceae bacterium]